MSNRAINIRIALGFAWFAVGFGIMTLDYIYKTRQRPAAICKICHCGKTICSADCGEEAMCNMRCNSECRRNHE